MADSKSHECCSDHVTAGRQAIEKEWQTAWYDGDCKDANREVSKWLKEYINKLTGEKPKCRILVPMCGATRDMQWLIDEGHEVIGVELSKDKKISLYRCNIFEMDMSLVGKVDCVWDCGAMTDIPPAERKSYAEIILSALNPGGRILAETFTFGEIKGVDHEHGQLETGSFICKYGVNHNNDPPHDHCHEHNHVDQKHTHDQHHGHEHLGAGHDGDFPCRPVEEEDFQKMYGEHCSIEMICKEDSKEAEEWGPSWWANNRLHLIIVK